jgi:hypothetical protein
VSAAYAGRLRVRSPELGAPVLERIVMALAARVDLPVDRIADAQLVIEALVETVARRSPDGVLDVVLGAGPAGVDLSVGPLPAGAAALVVADSTLPGVGVVLDRLVDQWGVEPLDAGGEALRLTIGPGAPAVT